MNEPLSSSKDSSTPPGDAPEDNRALKDAAEAGRRGGGAIGATERSLGGNPVGAAAGAVAGAAAGAIGGLAAGPVGSAFGAVAGAVLGGLAGGRAETGAGETVADDGAWRAHHAGLPPGGAAYEALEPAYRIGDAAGSGDWDEDSLARSWAEAGSALPWDRARPAARHGWELAQRRRASEAPANDPRSLSDYDPYKESG
ncbi:hypothetical protein [Roseateles violae]|uniref:Glycine zipper domain-containing protein n=1 Tax=Roseateles violae TaxID=3058042 RepID=A0ABT8DRI3_9BURK|nr:hypothetical protein [Pelomonas sp. PFR6]MDN3920583.1 hypothetical protein [Pelomonas sp. PFR6]